MTQKTLMTAILIIAIILAVLSLIPAHKSLVVVVFASRFFEVMLPILGVGALLKWIFFHDNGCGDKSDSGCCK